MCNLTIVFHDAGGGHRNAACALRSIVEEEQRPWNVRLLNIQELLEPVDIVHRTTGLRLQDGYNLLLRKGWTRITPQLLVLLRYTIRLHHGAIVRRLRSFWAAHPADLVLSVIPHFNRCLAESIRKEIPGTAFVTLLTDLADYPPNFWITRESEYIVCGSARAREQALAMGHPEARVYQMSGMVLKPSLYHQPAVDRARERVKLGLRPDLPTGLVMFGGHGSTAMLDIAKRVERSRHGAQWIFLCGHNMELAAKIRSLESKRPMRVEGFTTDVGYFMTLADFFVGKAGPGSISEALHFGLPVVVERNARTMPQERYNAQWLREKRLGIVVGDFGQIELALEQLLDESMFRQLRANVSRYRNDAVFEVPLILDRVIASKVMESRVAPPTLTPLDSLANAAWAGLT